MSFNLFQVMLLELEKVLVTAIPEYLKRVLKHTNQNLDQPFVLVTPSTGIAAISACGITLHSLFYLPVK